MNTIKKYPLCWPDSVPRTAPHQRGVPNFDERSLDTAVRFVCAEINRLNDRHWNHDDESVIISSNLRYKADGTPCSNQSDPADSGIAVYFTLRINRNGKIIERPIVMSCDKWRKASDNLWAIGKDIEAQRARARWGCANYEQSFRGYLAIPERCGGDSWWVLLGVDSTATKEKINQRYRDLAKTRHPDKGGNPNEWTRLNEAYEQAMAAFSK